MSAMISVGNGGDIVVCSLDILTRLLYVSATEGKRRESRFNKGELTISKLSFGQSDCKGPGIAYIGRSAQTHPEARLIAKSPNCIDDEPRANQQHLSGMRR